MSQSQKIAAFLADTVLANEQTATEYLNFYDGNLELAIENYFADYAPH